MYYQLLLHVAVAHCNQYLVSRFYNRFINYGNLVSM